LARGGRISPSTLYEGEKLPESKARGKKKGGFPLFERSTSINRDAPCAGRRIHSPKQEKRDSADCGKGPLGRRNFSSIEEKIRRGGYPQSKGIPAGGIRKGRGGGELLAHREGPSAKMLPIPKSQREGTEGSSGRRPVKGGGTP